MRGNHCKQLLSVWACTSAIALLSSSAAFAELPQHPVIQTLEATHEEIQPDPEELPQSLLFGQAVAIRDGTAFVGMPQAFDRGRVAIFTQTGEQLAENRNTRSAGERALRRLWTVARVA